MLSGVILARVRTVISKLPNLSSCRYNHSAKKNAVTLSSASVSRLHTHPDVTRHYSSTPNINPESMIIGGEHFPKDNWSNISPRVLDKIGRNLHNQKQHPLWLIRKRIQNYFYKSFVNSLGNPIFAVFDNLSPVVSIHQNFESLLIPREHPSWSPSDAYFVNESTLLRGHTSAHEEELIKMGFDAFLVVGDVYRRDEIDATHYPVFHQLEGVRLFSQHKLFDQFGSPVGLEMFEKSESGKRTQDKQAEHSVDAVKLLEHNLKQTLMGLAHHLFGKDVESRWVECYFPFTHPSWELEILHQGEWLEVLGCGILEQKILNKAGANNLMGWAFGLGLERLAMKLYNIPDIRLFWSEDEQFLSQFRVDNPDTNISYKAISQFPPCINDISFWVPESYTSNDFYDLTRTIAGDIVEQVSLVDEFKHPKTGRLSHCYQIRYRHMEKTLTQEEVNVLHKNIERTAAEQLGVEIR